MTWLNNFYTYIDVVDEQHKKLFELLQILCNGFENKEINDELLNKAFNDMNSYAQKHFVDEELLMAHHKLDERHIRIHRMEHNSFMYDTEQLGVQLSSKKNLDHITLEALLEKTISFITAWLTYHILGMDQMMAGQIRAIEQGAKPEMAYNAFRHIEYDAETTRIILNAVLRLWQISTERCHELEKKLAEQQNTNTDITNN